jgi:hypothetical protein
MVIDAVDLLREFMAEFMVDEDVPGEETADDTATAIC